MNKMIYVVVLGCFLLAGAITTQAQTQRTVPVEVHIWRGKDRLVIYDCWPMGAGNPPEENSMIVYLNYQDGIAGYLCHASGEFNILPPPCYGGKNNNLLASY